MGNVQLKKKRKVPELRFPEFSGEWEEKKLGEVVSFKKGKGIPKRTLTEYGTKCILYGQLYTTYNEIITGISSYTDIDEQKLLFGNMGDILIPSSGETALDMSLASALLVDNVALGGDINILRPKNNTIDSKFLSYQINSARKIDLARIAEGASVVHLYNDNLKDVIVVNPKDTAEQQKIGNFFYTIDKKLELQEEKIDTLKEYKKGMMQKIFSQEIRFKDDDGKDFPDWEEKRLEDMGEFLTSSVDKKIKENEIIVNLCNYMDVYNRLEIRNNNLDILNKTSATEMQIKNNNLLKGDILLTPSSETSDDIGHSIVIWEDLKNTVYSYHLLRFRPHIKMDLKFSNYWFNSEAVRKHFIIRAQGATRFTISINNIKDIIVKYPTIREQEKIGKLLYSIDKKIELEEEKLENMKKFKKGLMQRMFV